MKFDVYGRFQLEIVRENDSWVAYRPGTGTRSRDSSIVIPKSLTPEEIPGYLDDLFHELCGPGQSVRVVS